jgi:regulator of protease activity HflC (stomatin/prohibitin superfamily)/sugar lactone lactonase YvrE
LVALAFVLLFSVVKIVPQGREMTVERFGKYTRTLAPGISILTPFVERIGRRMNMMEQVLDVPQQEVITKDNAMVKVDAIVFIQVMEASAAAYRVENLPYAITQLCSTNLRTVVGSMDLDEVLFQRDNINSRLLTVIDAATEPWGVKVNRIEIKDLTPPVDITNAMARQMKAERERRAVITEAEGEKQAAIARAEGAKQSAILQAEGRKEAAFRDAEARERSAEAEAKATSMVSEAITKGDLAGDLTLHRLLVDGEGWQPVVDGLGNADAACSDAAGNFYYADIKNPGIFKVTADGTKTRLSAETASGLKFGPDGKLYGCLAAKKRLFTVDPVTGTIDILLEDVQPNDLVITRRGHIFFTETARKQVTFFDPATKTKRIAATDLANPNGITLSPDEGTLAVSEHAGEFVWTFRVAADGTLDAKMPTMTMRRPVDPKGEFKHNNPPPYVAAARGDGMTTDTLGRTYVTTTLGVQVFDPTGRLCGVIGNPVRGRSVTSCVLSGPERGLLYVTSGSAIFRRKVLAKGIPTGTSH